MKTEPYVISHETPNERPPMPQSKEKAIAKENQAAVNPELKDNTLMMVKSRPLRALLCELLTEMDDARLKYGSYHSAHEFYGVLMEEVHELLIALHQNDDEQMELEALQCAAVCIRFVSENRERRGK